MFRSECLRKWRQRSDPILFKHKKYLSRSQACLHERSQNLQSFPSLAEVGAPCLGTPLIENQPSAISPVDVSRLLRYNNTLDATEPFSPWLPESRRIITLFDANRLLLEYSKAQSNAAFLHTVRVLELKLRELSLAVIRQLSHAYALHLISL